MAIKGVVLAGGEGTRFRPLTYYFQKCMIPIGEEQKPILDYILRLFKYHGIKKTVLLVGYKHQQIENYFDHGERFGVEMSYVLDDPNLKGSANAILNAYKKGAISDDDTLVVYYGDILSNLDLSAMLKHHQEKKADATLALARKYNISVGKAELDGTKITNFVEKPDLMQPISIGILILSGSILRETANLQQQGQFRSFDLMGDVISYLVQRGRRVEAFLTDAFWYDVGSIERYERLSPEKLSEVMGFLLK
jgi:mannose-1-phosphate guanylyltransferase